MFALLKLQKRTRPMESFKNIRRPSKCHKTKREEHVKQNSVLRKTQWIHCPSRCDVKTSSDWFLMDHFAKRHHEKDKGLASFRHTTTDSYTNTYFVRKLFEKYTHTTRKAQDENTSISTCQQTAKNCKDRRLVVIKEKNAALMKENNPHVRSKLLRCGDVEQNPGPQSAVTGVGLDCNEKEPTEHLPGNCEQHTGTEKGQKRLCEETEEEGPAPCEYKAFYYRTLDETCSTRTLNTMIVRNKIEDEAVDNFRMYLRGLSIPDLEKEKANYATGNTVRDLLLKHIRDVTTGNAKFRFEGSVEKIGSSWDGSKLHQVDEVDLLFILSKRQIGFIQTDDTVRVEWCGHVYKPRELVEHFADSLESVLSRAKPEYLQHGGYAAPEFSGVRLCGPAVTVLYQTQGDDTCEKGTNISVDITLAVPLSCLGCAEELESALKGWKDKKLKQVNEPMTCCLGLHAVPNTSSDRWQLSSALFESERLNQLGSESTVRKSYLLLKALLHRVDRKALEENIFGINVTEMNANARDLCDQLVASINQRSLCRDQLNKCMRYGHTLLPRSTSVSHGELEKELVSINKAASKHILLDVADPTDFEVKHLKSKRVIHLMKQVIEQLVSSEVFVNHVLQKLCADHALHSPEICKFSFRKFIVLKWEVMAMKLQRCYMMVLEYCLSDENLQQMIISEQVALFQNLDIDLVKKRAEYEGGESEYKNKLLQIIGLRRASGIQATRAEPKYYVYFHIAKYRPPEDCWVEDFVVGHRDFGFARFPGQTNIGRLNLADTVTFKQRHIDIYPDESCKPDVGIDLNRNAEITLYRVRPRNCSSDIEKCLEMKRRTAGMGATFLDYEPQSGRWSFKVEHFTGYGLSSDSEEDPDEDQDKELGNVLKCIKDFLNKQESLRERHESLEQKIQCDIHEGLQQLQQLKKEYIHTEHDLLTSGSGNRDSSSLDALVALKDKLQQARSDLGVQYEKLFQTAAINHEERHTLQEHLHKSLCDYIQIKIRSSNDQISERTLRKKEADMQKIYQVQCQRSWEIKQIIIEAKNSRTKDAVQESPERHVTATKDVERQKYENGLLSNFNVSNDFLVDQLPELNVGPGESLFDKDNDVINVVIVGRTGVGKSATGNMILGRERVFDEAPDTPLDRKTVKFQTETMELDGIRFRITDSPGIFDKGNKGWWKFHEDIEDTLVRVKQIHVFLYVVSLETPFCPHALTTFRSYVGWKAIQHTLLLCTHPQPKLQNKGLWTILTQIDRRQPFGQFIKDIQGNYLAVDNKAAYPYIRERQRKALLQHICSITARNDSPFTGADIPYYWCFPGNSICVTEDIESVTLSQLKAGDRVLTVDSTGNLLYEDLFLWSHAIPHTQATFVSITTEHGNVLRLSPGHFLHLQAVGNLVTAQDVRPMDTVFVVCPDLSIIRPEQVVSVAKVVARGLYCPHTTGGSLVVDGVLVSCYTDLLPPTIAHHALAPVRFLYHTLPSSCFRFLLPYDQGSGMPKLLMYLRWLLCQGKEITAWLYLRAATLLKPKFRGQMELCAFSNNDTGSSV